MRSGIRSSVLTSQIIGHDTTRRRLTGPGSLKERTYLTNGSGAIATRFTLLKRQISEATDPQQRAILERQLAIHQQYADEQAKLSRRRRTRRCRAT